MRNPDVVLTDYFMTKAEEDMHTLSAAGHWTEARYVELMIQWHRAANPITVAAIESGYLQPTTGVHHE